MTQVVVWPIPAATSPSSLAGTSSKQAASALQKCLFVQTHAHGVESENASKVMHLAVKFLR